MKKNEKEEKMEKFMKFTILIGAISVILYVLLSFYSSYFTSKEIVVIKEGEAISDSSCYQKLMGRSDFGEFRQTVCRTKVKWYTTGREEVDKLLFPLLKGEGIKFCKVITYYNLLLCKIRINTEYEYRR